MTSGETQLPIKVRAARAPDVRAIAELVDPLARERILLGKDLVDFYEQVQGFFVAETEDGAVVGCGALHVMWEDLAEIRTLAVTPNWRGRGVGRALVTALVARAQALRLQRIFCLTFEVPFFQRQGFEVIEGTPVSPEVYVELLRSQDDGVAEFLDLARVKPNTLGNTRMMRVL